jgi:hypothetical protein
MAQHYSGYSKFSIEPHQVYDFDGLTIENNSSEEYHIFIKKLDDIEVEFEKKIGIEVSKIDFHPAHCCCLSCLEGDY